MVTSRIWFTAAQKTELWERWRQGQSISSISRALAHQLAGPMMRPAAGLQRHKALRLLSEKLQHLSTCNPAAENPLAPSIRAVSLKDILCDIQSDRDNLCHGRLLLVDVLQHLPWHIDAVGGRPHGVISGSESPWSARHGLGWLFPDKMEVRAHDGSRAQASEGEQPWENI